MWLWTPAADLRPAVTALWATEARTVAFRELVLPRPNVELMINFGGAQRLHTARGMETHKRAWVSGLHTSCLEIESPCAAQLIAASLHPAHAGPLLGVTGRELAGRVTPLSDVIGFQSDDLATRLEEGNSVANRFLIFEGFLRQLLRYRRDPHAAVQFAVERLMASGGRATIREVADRLGCSRRYLESRLVEEIGLAPKRLARLVRFSHAVERTRSDEVIELGQLALECGYYDQAHFNRDFREFAGVSPGGFLASRDSSGQAMLVNN